MRKFFLIFLAALLPACTDVNQSAPVGRYESSAWGFHTNTWWIEGPSGVVLVDTQFLPSAIEEAVEIAETYTGKKVVLAFVLHPNPDKFNGVAALKKRGIRVVSLPAVIDAIPEVDKLRRAWFYERYQPDYPPQLVLPESLGEATTLRAAGLTFTLHALGPSVSKAHLVVQLGKHVFVGDMLANKHHAWLELGLVDEWIAALEKIKALNPQYVYPGRGYASSARLIDEQIAYLNFVRTTVKTTTQCKPFTDRLKAAMIEAIETKYPNYGNPYFLNRAMESVWTTACQTTPK